jgi:hypothetical protein
MTETFEILNAAGEVENTIVAGLAFVEKVYPGRFRRASAPPSDEAGGQDLRYQHKDWIVPCISPPYPGSLLS